MLRFVLFSAFVLTGVINFSQTTVNIPVAADATIFSDSTHYADGRGVLRSGKICNGNERRMLMYFDLSAYVPLNATVTDVRLDVNVFAGGSGIGNDSYKIYQLQEEWTEGPSLALSGQGVPATTNDVTWNDRTYNSVAWSTPGGTFDSTASDTLVFTTTMGNYSWTSAELINDVQFWANNPSQNYGWIIISDTASGPCSARKFGSKDTLVAPSLYVEYECLSPPFCVWASYDEQIVDVNFYPNPADDFLIIKAEGYEGFTVQIVDVNGKMMDVASTFTNVELTLDLSEVPSGCYFILFTHNTSVIRKKLIKK